MPIPKISFEESLQKHVLPEKCMSCATCVVVCPFGCLDYVDEKPKIVKECTLCGICVQVCPRYDMSWAALERFLFGRERKPDEDFGIYQRLLIARSTDNTILQVCQDGGVVSSILKFALENGIIDGAAISETEKNKPLYPIPKLATTTKQVLECAGTRYSYSPNILAYNEGVTQKKKNLVFVGTPCQIHALRMIQLVPLKKYSEKLAFTIGLMCTESFDYNGLINHIQMSCGVSPKEIKKMNIKGKLLVTTKFGEVKTVPLAEVKQYSRGSCVLCSDFSAELADISAGGVGLDNWTLVILRTDKGEEIFNQVERAGLLRTKSVEEEKTALNLLIKLSRRKRERRLSEVQN